MNLPYTEEYIRHLRRSNRIFQSINVVAALSMAILFWAIVHQQHQLTRQNHTIQTERVESFLRGCRDQDDRNRNTIKTLDRLLSNLPPKQRTQANATKQFTVLLINALAPVRNCKQVAKLVAPSSN